MHQRIAKSTLDALDPERAGYFSEIIALLENDPRTELHANFAYLLLKETMILLPVYLGKNEFINLMFAYLEKNHDAMRRVIYHKDYASNPASLRPVTDQFVHNVVARILQRYEEGEIESGEPTIQKFTWPYRAEDLVDPDDDDEVADELENRPAYTGPERRRNR